MPFPTDDADNPATAEEVQAWLTEGFSRIKEEVECLGEHWESFIVPRDSIDMDEAEADIYSIVKHLESMSLGTTTIMSVLFKFLVPPEMMAEIVRERMEIERGEPVRMEAVRLGGGIMGFAFTAEPIVVPDDIEEILGAGDGDD